MAYNHEWPYSDIERQNTDWEINEVKKVRKEMDEFTGYNQIKFADPIEWSSTTYYKRYTVVLYTDGNSYMAKKDVPVGIPPVETEYWQLVANNNAQLELLKEYVEGVYGVVVTPEMFGAVGDGVADDTAAIQAAVNIAQTVVFGKDKTYCVYSSIVTHDDTYLDFNGSTIHYHINSTAPNRIIRIDNKKNVTVCNGKITTDYIDHALDNVQVVGIHGLGAQSCEVFNMVFDNLGIPNEPSGHIQVFFGVNSSATQDASNNRVHHCVFNSIYDSFNVRFSSDWLSVDPVKCFNNVVEYCIFNYSKKSCVEMAGYTTYECCARFNIITNCGTEAMDIDKSAFGCEISSNRIIKCSGSDEVPQYVPYGGISVQTYDGVSSDINYVSRDNVVRDNIIEETVGCGIYISGTKNAIVSGNKVASAKWGLSVGRKGAGPDYVYTTGQVTENVFVASEIGINGYYVDDLAIKDNLIESASAVSIQNAKSNKSYVEITGNLIKFSDTGVTFSVNAIAAINSNMMIAKEAGATFRYISASDVSVIDIVNNICSGLTAVGIQLFYNSTTASTVKATGNISADLNSLVISGTGTIDKLILSDNNFNIGIGDNITYLTGVLTNSRIVDDLESAAASLADASATRIIRYGNIAKISYHGTVSAAITGNTVLFNLSKELTPVTNQLITGFINATPTTLIVKTDGTIVVSPDSPISTTGALKITEAYVLN